MVVLLLQSLVLLGYIRFSFLGFEQLLLHLLKLGVVEVLLVLHHDVELAVLVLVVVDRLFEFINLPDLLLDLLFQNLILLLVLRQIVAFTVLELNRDFLLPAVALL